MIQSAEQAAPPARRGRPPAADQVPPPPVPEEGASLAERLRIREDFFAAAGIDPRQFLRAFDHVPGLYYFVKDAESRTLINTREYAEMPGHRPDEKIVGRRPGEYLAKDLADHYEADDRKVLSTGRPLRNIIEIGFNEHGVPDWIITDKFPLVAADGRIVGIVGTMQSLEGRVRSLPHLGAAGKAAAYIRQRLGERISLGAVASHVGLSERHLQRQFHKLIGMTVGQFVIHSRVHAAAHELTHSPRPLADIALAFGFSDQSAFTNTFRKLIGVSPRRHREQYLEGEGR